MIYLPTDRKYHTTRSIHKGSHPKYSHKVWRKLDSIDLEGSLNKWTNQDYEKAVENLMNKERKNLRKGRVRCK